MKKIIFIFSVIFVACSWQNLNAQCASCTPSFTNCRPQGGLCNRLDTAYANNPYNRQINFYMPPILTDQNVIGQCQCSHVILREIRVLGISGLPTGITYTLSQNGRYIVQNGDTVGCGQFCGTPLVAGMYPVVVHLEADVTAVGTPIGNVNQNNNPQQYLDTLWVLPDTTAGVSSFTYGNSGFVACDSITLGLNALLTAPAPNLTSYSWSFGNGQTSQAKTPGTVTYTNVSLTQPDTFPVTLTTVFYNYRVKSVRIDNINGGFCGDIEELACSCISGADSPDPFVKFPLLGYTSSDMSNTCSNVNFNNLNLSVPLGTQSISMEIWDKDTGPPFGSQDDQLGTYTLNVGLGQVAFSNSNASGHVVFDTVAGTVITETLYVIVNPYPAMPTVVASSDTFCSVDSVRITIDNSYSGYTFDWYRDSVYLTDATDSAFYTNAAGNYKVIVTNLLTGCASESEFKEVTRITSPPASINVLFNGTSAFVSPFPSSGFTTNWFFNGSPVANEHGKFLPFLGNGTYQVELYSTAYPSCSVWSTIDSITVSSINDLADNSIYGVNVFPNPNNGRFTLKFITNEPQAVQVNICDMVGRTLFTKKIENFNGEFSEEIYAEDWSKGVYFISLETAQGRKNEKVIVK